MSPPPNRPPMQTRQHLRRSDGMAGWVLLTYSGTPGTVNHGRAKRGQHWTKDRAHKAEWEGTFMVGFMQERLPKKLAHVKVWVQLQFDDPGRRRDPENHRHPFMKPFADTLTKGGYIVDDTAEFFEVVDFAISDQKLIVTPAERKLGRRSACHVALLYRVAP